MEEGRYGRVWYGNTPGKPEELIRGCQGLAEAILESSRASTQVRDKSSLTALVELL